MFRVDSTTNPAHSQRMEEEIVGCIKPGCQRTDIKARDMCGTHYDQWYVEQRTGVPVVSRTPWHLNQCEGEPGCSARAAVRKDGRVTCNKHEARWYRHGTYETLPAGPKKTGISDKGKCRLEICPKKARQFGGLCENHYHLLRRNGTTDDPPKVPDMTPENIWARTVPGTAETLTLGCKLWTGRLTPDGYANEYDPALHRAGKQGTVLVHRRLYELLHGEGSLGALTIDHRCHDPLTCPGGILCPHRRCMEEDHLVPESRSDNAKRSSKARREIAAITTSDPDEAVAAYMRKVFKPCGHFYPKYGPTCNCDETKVSA